MRWQRKGPPQRVANVREATRRKLDGLLARDRRSLWLMGPGAVAVVACLAVLGVQPPQSVGQVEGIVRTAYVDIDDTGQRHLAMEAELESDRRVRVSSHSLQPPKVGARIILTETVGWLGYHAYQWDGQTK